MARYVSPGRYVDYRPDADVASGDVVIVRDIVGVATRPIAANTLGALAVSGVFEFPKRTGSGTAIQAGAMCYWDSSHANDDRLGVYLGLCEVDASTTDATVRILLGPPGPPELESTGTSPGTEPATESTTAEGTTVEVTTAEATTAEGTTVEGTTVEGTTGEITTAEETTTVAETTTAEATTDGGS